MKFGLALANDFPPGIRPRDRIGQLLEQVAAARDGGFDSIWALQHYLGNLPTLQPLQFLARMSAEAGDMRVGTNMFILPLRHPVDVAEEFVTLDHIAPGGAIAGFGMGYRENEFAAFGIGLDQRKQRYQEAVEVVRALWSGEPVTYQGTHYRIDGESISTPPASPRGIPIWVGAGAHRTGVRRAAELGDAWITPPHVEPGTLREILEVYRAELGSVGARPDREIVVRREVLLHEDPEHARERGTAARTGQSRAYAAFNAPDRTVTYQHLSADDIDTEAQAVADRSYLFGDPDVCIESLREMEALGVTYVILRMQWHDLPHEDAMRSMELFAERVLPALGGLTIK